MGLIWTSGIPSQTSSYPGERFLALGDTEASNWSQKLPFDSAQLGSEIPGEQYQACVHQGDMQGIS